MSQLANCCIVYQGATWGTEREERETTNRWKGNFIRKVKGVPSRIAEILLMLSLLGGESNHWPSRSKCRWPNCSNGVVTVNPTGFPYTSVPPPLKAPTQKIYTHVRWAQSRHRRTAIAFWNVWTLSEKFSCEPAAAALNPNLRVQSWRGGGEKVGLSREGSNGKDTLRAALAAVLGVADWWVIVGLQTLHMGRKFNLAGLKFICAAGLREYRRVKVDLDGIQSRRSSSAATLWYWAEGQE